MERLLIFIKHHSSLLWSFLEWSNSFVFDILYKSSMDKVIQEVLNEFSRPPYFLRRLNESDSIALMDLIKRQNTSDLEFFKPHGFDIVSIRRQLKKHSFLMMGAFVEKELHGYFFLRFFFNKRCFVGRLVDKTYRGQGLGRVMNSIMYETAWRMGFRCLSTISKHNVNVIRAHAKNSSMVLRKELDNDYLLIEFIK